MTFVQTLLDQIAGHVTVVWDGAPIHCSHVVKAFLAAGAAKRLQLEQLPGYAPDLTPDEGVWNDLKRGELANVCCRDLGELTTHLIQANERLRAKPDILRACSRECGYLVEFLTATSVVDLVVSKWIEREVNAVLHLANHHSPRLRLLVVANPVLVPLVERLQAHLWPW